MMKRFFALALLVVMTVFPTLAQGFGAYERPKLVVGIVVDQMRWDYLDYYYNDFGEGGFRRLMNEGYSCDNHFINYVPTVTAVGHSCNYTGSIPALTGIAGNNFYKDGKKTYCTDDETVQTVGSNSDAGKMSPRNLLVSTMSDQLKLATDFRSKVIGVSLKDRASILPAGHAADAAYWFDSKNGVFISSTYYMKQLPKWVNDFNKAHRQTKDIRTTPAGLTIVADMALAAIDGEDLGNHDVTDFLAVSFSSTDYIGHEYGTRAPITREAYKTLDADLARLFARLDAKLGKGNYLVFLTADHAATHNAEFQKKHKLSADVWNDSKAKDEANAFLSSKFNTQNKLVKNIIEYRVYLDHEAIKSAGTDLDDVEEALCSYLMSKNEILYAVSFTKVSEASIPEPIKTRIINGYNPKRSGDIQIITTTGVYADGVKPNGGTTHGTWNPFDSHIPMLFYGWNVPKGHTTRETHITDLAATICAMLHIQMPNGCVGEPIQF